MKQKEKSIKKDKGKKTRRQNSLGFTLIEVIVSLGILCIGVLVLASFFAFSSKTTLKARYLTTASNLAQGCIDENIAKSYEELTVGEGAKSKFSEDSNDPYYAYQKQINIFLIDSSLAKSINDLGMKRIECIISWNETSGEKNVTADTVKIEK